MADRKTLWTLTNDVQQRIICTLEERDENTFVVSVSLELDVVVTEVHYTPAAAITRARMLRDSLACGDWSPSR